MDQETDEVESYISYTNHQNEMSYDNNRSEADEVESEYDSIFEQASMEPIFDTNTCKLLPFILARETIKVVVHGTDYKKESIQDSCLTGRYELE
jgi:hypothetical protein